MRAMEMRKSTRRKTQKTDQIYEKDPILPDQHVNHIQFQPESEMNQEKQHQSERKVEKTKKDTRNSHQSMFAKKCWSTKEKVRLLVFFSFYQDLPSWGNERKSIAIYKHMSTFIKTKTPQQCKNIHSLFRRKYKHLSQTIQPLIEELSAHQNYQKMHTKYQKEIQKFQGEHFLREQMQGYPMYQPRGYNSKPQPKDELPGRQKMEDECIINIAPYLSIPKQHEKQPYKIKSKQPYQIKQPEIEIKKEYKQNLSQQDDDAQNASQLRRKELCEQATYHWKQYLMAMLVLSKRGQHQVNGKD